MPKSTWDELSQHNAKCLLIRASDHPFWNLRIWREMWRWSVLCLLIHIDTFFGKTDLNVSWSQLHCALAGTFFTLPYLKTSSTLVTRRLPTWPHLVKPLNDDNINSAHLDANTHMRWNFPIQRKMFSELNLISLHTTKLWATILIRWLVCCITCLVLALACHTKEVSSPTAQGRTYLPLKVRGCVPSFDCFLPSTLVRQIQMTARQEPRFTRWKTLTSLMLLAHEYIFLPHSDFHPFSPFCQSHSNVQVTDFTFIRMTPKAFQRIPSKGTCMNSFVETELHWDCHWRYAFFPIFMMCILPFDEHKKPLDAHPHLMTTSTQLTSMLSAREMKFSNTTQSCFLKLSPLIPLITVLTTTRSLGSYQTFAIHRKLTFPICFRAGWNFENAYWGRMYHKVT